LPVGDVEMEKRLLYFFRDVGLLEQIPDVAQPRTVLARSVCPLHDGADNPHALLLYADGFVCTTKNCHRDRRFGLNLHGLVRHLVFRLTGKVMDWWPAWCWARKNVTQVKKLFEGNVEQARGGNSRRVVNYTRDDLLACLKVPDPYYVSRGFQPDTLRDFSVGTCISCLPDGRRLLGWSIIPVCELTLGVTLPLGYTARNPRWVEGGPIPRWIHAVSPKECLFNYDRAFRARELIICEGPGDVMRWYEAGYPGGVATLGASLSDTQFHLLVILIDPHLMKVYVAADADEPGRAFGQELHKRLRSVCEPILLVPPQGKDFGELPASTLRDWFRDRAA
jgi:hypothetical protein